MRVVVTLDDERLDAMFAALADRTRRDIVARLRRGEATVKELAEPYGMTLPGGAGERACRALRDEPAGRVAAHRRAGAQRSGQPRPVPPDPPVPPRAGGAG